MINPALNLVTVLALAVIFGGCGLRTSAPADPLNAMYWIEGQAGFLGSVGYFLGDRIVPQS